MHNFITCVAVRCDQSRQIERVSSTKISIEGFEGLHSHLRFGGVEVNLLSIHLAYVTDL
jgi:hypothetical protein